MRISKCKGGRFDKRVKKDRGRKNMNIVHQEVLESKKV